MRAFNESRGMLRRAHTIVSRQSSYDTRMSVSFQAFRIRNIANQRQQYPSPKPSGSTPSMVNVTSCQLIQGYMGVVVMVNMIFMVGVWLNFMCLLNLPVSRVQGIRDPILWPFVGMSEFPHILCKTPLLTKKICMDLA